MSSTEPVPETRMMPGDELSADDAFLALRHYGRWPLIRDAFVRFRYGDGFSHSRAFAFQLCLAIVPFLIALSGLATDLGAKAGGQVADTVVALSPGASEPLIRELLSDDERTERAGELALALGLITGLFALTSAMAQVERGANRIYGVERDRKALPKYLRAAVLAVIAGLPALFGFLLLVAGEVAGASIARHTGGGGAMWRTVWEVIRWPLSLALIVYAVGLLFRHSPRRKQPALSWLLVGAAVATVLWWGASVLLSAYVRFSGGFGATYGPLTAIMALLLWANLTGIAFFYGLAFAAQLEAQRVGIVRPAQHDRWHPGDEPGPSVPQPRDSGVSSDATG